MAAEELAHWLTRPQQAAFVRAVQAGKVYMLAVCELMLHAGLQSLKFVR